MEELVPGTMTLGAAQKVLQNLVKEGVSIRDMLTIVETMADYGVSIKDPDQLTEYVRSRMGRTIVKPFLTADSTLPILNLAPPGGDPGAGVHPPHRPRFVHGP